MSKDDSQCHCYKSINLIDMKIAEIPLNEAERLADLQEYKIMDTPPEVVFDDLVQLAANVAKVPMSLIVLIDEKRQWFKSSVSIGFKETSRELSFCSHTIRGNSLLLVRDTEKDERFCDNPFVTGDPGVRFYAGIPLLSYRGNAIGTLCVLDTVPNDLNEEQRFALNVLSQQVVKLLELKRANDNLEQFHNSQNLFMSMILRDIKSPLASTGTFLNLLENEIDIRLDMLKYAPIAARQFNGNLALLDCVMEWGMIYNNRKDAIAGVIDTDIFLAGLIRDQKKISYSRQYSLSSKVPDVQMEISCPRELYFIINSSILWLFDCAESGEIVIEDISSRAQGVAIRITMASKSYPKTLGALIDKLNAGSLWQENPDIALDGLPFRLAKDIALSKNGSLVASYNREGIIEVNIYIQDNWQRS